MNLICITAILAFLASCGGTGAGTVGTQKDSTPSPVISSLAISPGNLQTDLGIASFERVTATYTDGSSADVTSNAQWSSTPPGYVHVTADGTVLPITAGSTNVAANFAGLRASAEVTVTEPSVESSLHQTLADQYIWSDSSAGPDVFRYIRGTFVLDSLPAAATIYVAGPRYQIVWVNGVMIANNQIGADAPTLPLVTSANVSNLLVAGSNVIAVAAAYGDRIAVKLVAGAESVNGPTIKSSDATWRYSYSSDPGWQATNFNGDAWPAAVVVGGVEADSAQFQGKLDSEMYRWPGYDGISGFLGHRVVRATAVLNVTNGAGMISGTDLLTGTSAAQLNISLPQQPATQADMPSLVLDFGRELNGRISLTSSISEPSVVDIQYGESLAETVNAPYYGENRIAVPPQTRVFGPKAGFRYVLIRFVSGPPLLKFSDISADQIFYPVGYAGWFDSSDAALNAIWQTAARTALLNMQEQIWDGIKRDRLPWMGDVYVTEKTINNVFAERPLLKSTLDGLGRASTASGSDVNNIPGYSAFWVMGLSDYYRSTGDIDFLRSENANLDSVVAAMDKTIAPDGVFSFPTGEQPFVDWSPGFFDDTQDSRSATQFELYKGFVEASFLYRELANLNASDEAAATAAQLKSSSQTYSSSGANTYGDRWQTNAMAIYSGIANLAQQSSIWSNVLSQPPAYPVTPYYTYFAVEAMSIAGHDQDALNWIRNYWGDMLREDATCFWEAYDPSWLQTDFHAALQADNTQGYYVSLCHGWSSGPATWLMQHVLGVQGDFSSPAEVVIRPALFDLQSARGAVPTPFGTFSVTYSKSGNMMEGTVVVPPGAHALLSLPVTAGTNTATVNGATTSGNLVESGSRAQFNLPSAGTYTFSAVLQ